MNRVIKHPASHREIDTFSTTEELLNINFVKEWKEMWPWKNIFKNYSYGIMDFRFPLNYVLYVECNDITYRRFSIAYLELEEGFKLDIPFVEK
jgi:hypothetical protein